MQKLVFINSKGVSVDLTKAPFGITEWSGFSNVDLNLQTQQVPFYDGSVYLDGLLSEREIGVTLAINDEKDLEKRYELRRELISILNPKLGEGTLIYTNNFISKQIKAVPQTPLFANHNSNDSGTPKANLIWTCPSPYWEDLEENVVFFKLGEVAKITNNGDYPAQMEMDFFTTNAVNPGITNLTTGKKIIYKGTLNENLYINTNVGEKRISKEQLIFDILNVGNDITDLLYSDKLLAFYAIERNILFYSYDGVNWKNSVLSDEISQIDKMCYSENLGIFVAFVFYDDGRYVALSTDGINWTKTNYSDPFIYSDIKYFEEKNIFMMVATPSGKLRVTTSPDGINWSSQTTQISARNGGHVCYSKKLDLFVICTQDVISFTAYPKIVTSTDGTNWSEIDVSSLGLRALNSICYSEELELFIAVGNNGFIIKSSDGINWTTVSSNTSRNLYDVAYFDESKLFVAVGDVTILTSSDGINWNNLTINGISINKISYSNISKIFTIVGDDGKIGYSYDLTNWTLIGNKIGNCLETIYIPKMNKYVVLGGDKIYATSDFINWELSNGVSSLIDMTYSNKLDLLVIVSSSTYYTPTDFPNISAHTIPYNVSAHSVCYSEELELFVMVGESGAILTSTDGTNWTQQNSNTNVNLNKVYYFSEKEMFVAIGKTILTSTDGINWTQRYTTLDFSIDVLNSMCYSKNLDLFVVIVNSSDYSNVGVITSSDGINWSELISLKDFAGAHYLYSITYSEKLGLFMIVGTSGTLLISSNIINWNIVDSNVSNSDLFYVNFFKEFDAFLICGINGIILKSLFSEGENKIENLSEDSDISLNLEIGENQLRLTRDSGDFTCRVKYRQKYIGV